MKKSFLVFLLTSLLGAGVFAAPSSNMDIVDTAINAGQFTTLVSLVQKTGLEDVLRSQDVKYTLFAPPDAAFARVPKEQLDALLADPDGLKKVLLCHIALGVYPSNLLKLGVEPEALCKISLTGGFDNGVFQVNFANVLLPDIHASNGIIHVIDAIFGVSENNN